MSRNYKFHHPEGLYFVSFAVVNWIDVLQETNICIAAQLTMQESKVY